MTGPFEKIEHLNAGNIRSLLIVEDDSVLRKTLKALIGSSDVETVLADTGEAALKLIAAHRFDCMILDVGLPDGSGLDLLIRLREDETISGIPTIVYTGKELTAKEGAVIDAYAEKLILKGPGSENRLIDETALFLHRVEDNLPEEKRKIIRMLHDREAIFKGKKILLVDDDMRNVYALSNVLEEKGLIVRAAPNGRKGIHLLEKDPHMDLVLMDIMMSEMDGYEAMDMIRRQTRFKKLPIIALTAKAMKGDRQRCIEAGANDYLAKPVNTDKLLSMLRVWLY